MKPGVPWPEIEKRVRAGESMRAISRDMKERGTPISHTSISKRSTRLGWKSPTKDWLPDARKSDTARRIKNPQTKSDLKIVNGNRSPELMSLYLEKIESGLNQRTACARIHMNEDSVRAWIADDPEFAACIEEAQVLYIEGPMQAINDASERGDWSAARYLVERFPLTKDDFHQGAGKGAPAVKIIFETNIPAPGTVEAHPITTAVIDMVADDEADDDEAA